MAELTLEQRVAALERTVAELNAERFSASRTRKLWRAPEPLSPETLQALEQVNEYGRYIRKTGRTPPDHWKPGDPIPIPEWWS